MRYERGYDGRQAKTTFDGFEITWGEWMDDSTDDIRVAECINDALKSLPSNILDKITKIDIRR
ncbi:hypothetical protein LCGC14_2802900 [marine sediment metagenome]|uniref:Uncharacterized protein n=1 Tax=marine sediment metagenome TaxID=412755 RepID=A0A0F8YM78_9ZZZZ